MPLPTPEGRAQLESAVETITDALFSQNTAAKVRGILKRIVQSAGNRADDGLPAVTPGVASFASTTGSPYDNGALAAALRNANSRPGPHKIVLNLSDRALLDPLSLCLEATCTVVNLAETDPDKHTVLKYTTFGPGTFQVCRDGNFNPAIRSDAQWYSINAPEANAPNWAGLQSAPPTADHLFHDGDFVRWAVGGSGAESFFTAIGDGVWDMPSNVDGDDYWLAIDGSDVPISGGATSFPQITGDPADNAALVDFISGKADLNGVTGKLVGTQFPAGQGLRESTGGLFATTAVDYVSETPAPLDPDNALTAELGHAYTTTGNDVLLPAISGSDANGLLIALRNKSGSAASSVFLADGTTLLTTLFPAEYLWLKYEDTGYEVVVRGSVNGLANALDPYDVSGTIRAAVTAGTFTSGELDGTQPAGSRAGMEFTTTTYGYKYQRGAAGTLVWNRYAKS